MKKWIPALAALCIIQCRSEHDSQTGDPYILHQEIFTTRAGQNEVYGAHYQTFSERHEFRNFAVQLSLNDKVWTDTVRMELTAGDTLQYEVIFARALTGPNDRKSLRVKSFPLEP